MAFAIVIICNEFFMSFCIYFLVLNYFYKLVLKLQYSWLTLKVGDEFCFLKYISKNNLELANHFLKSTYILFVLYPRVNEVFLG